MSDKPSLVPTENPFAVRGPEWVSLQVYAENGVRLPADDAAMARLLELEITIDVAKYADLTQVFHGIATHCGTWKDTTFPQTVSLANDLVHYAQKAPIYYDALLTYQHGLEQGDTAAQAKWTAILDALAAQAAVFQTNAALVRDAILEFGRQTHADANALNGVHQAYDRKYDFQTSIQSLKTQIDSLNQELSKDEDEYNDDMVELSISKSYVWIYPFGTLAAAMVSEKYGKKAVEMMIRIRVVKQLIEFAKDELATDQNLYAVLKLADRSMDGIKNALTAALPGVEKLHGIWGAIASDLSKLSTIIKRDIPEALPIILDLGVADAISQWKKFGAEADAYRVNAFVTIEVKEPPLVKSPTPSKSLTRRPRGLSRRHSR